MAEKQLALTERELRREVALAYYQLLYAKEDQKLAAENIALHFDFLTIANTQLETGETGKIPLLAARSRLGKARLEEEHAHETWKIALTLFNQWLQSDTLYDALGELIADTYNMPVDTLVSTNPHVQIIQAQRELANAKISNEKAQLLPQISSGVRLQTAFGNFPLFGYQIGINTPLFKKGYNSRIEAAEIGVKVQEAALQTKIHALQRTTSALQYRLEHQIHVVEYLEQDLIPIVNEQNETNLKAYREGEIGYLEYLDSLEQVIEVKHQLLEALYELNVLQVELEYWR